MRLWQVSVVASELLRGTSDLLSHAAATVEQVCEKIDIGLGNEPLNHINDKDAERAAEQFMASKTPPAAPIPAQNSKTTQPDFENMSIQQLAEYAAAGGESAHGGFDDAD